MLWSGGTFLRTRARASSVVVTRAITHDREADTRLAGVLPLVNELNELSRAMGRSTTVVAPAACLVGAVT